MHVALHLGVGVYRDILQRRTDGAGEVTLTPDSQPGDAYEWAKNQAGHAIIGFGLSLVVGPLVAVLAYFIAWEVLYQIRQQGGGWRDSVADSLFVGVGGLLSAYPAFQVHIYAGFMVMVLIGARYRR